MDLFDNPFHILGLTPRDDIRRIEESAEERSLLSDVDACMKARSILTNPRKRISAEVAWLPGVNQNRADEMLMLLEASAGSHRCRDKLTSIIPVDSLAAALSRLPCAETYNVADEVLDLLKLSEEHFLLESIFQPKRHSNKIDTLKQIRQYLCIEKLNSIARSNILAARMCRLPNYMPDDIAKWILAIAQAFEDIDPETVCATLNIERREASFPEITDVSSVAVEIQNRRYYYQQVIKSVLSNIHSAKERLNAIMMIVDESTIVHKKNRKPLLIDDTIDAYAVKATPILENEEKNINTQDQKLRYAADIIASDTTLAPLVDKLIQAVKNWHNMAQPILLKKKRMGFHDDASHSVAMKVRQLAIYLYNEHDKLGISQQILCMLREVFAEVPTITERITADLETLNKIADQREQKN